MDWKRIATIAGLIAVLVLAIVFTAKKIGGSSRPDWVGGVAQEKIDRQTLEVVSLPLGKWEKLGFKEINQERRYKNPKTGEYSMVEPMVCPHCGQKIPPAALPVISPEDLEKEKSDPAALDLRKAAARAAMNAYKCPRCGELVFGGKMTQKGEAPAQ